MNCFHLARSPALPPLARVSSGPKCLTGNSFSPSALPVHFYHKTLGNHALSRRKTSSLGFQPKPSNFSTGILSRTLDGEGIGLKLRSFFVGVRAFSTAENSVREKGRRPLPWRAAHRDRGGRRGEKRAAARTSRSSWVDSAESYLSRNGTISSDEMVESRDRADGREAMREEYGRLSRGRSREIPAKRSYFYAKSDRGEEAVVGVDEDVEPFEEQRSDGIRSKYRGLADRDDHLSRGRTREIRGKSSDFYAKSDRGEGAVMGVDEDVEPFEDQRSDGIRKKHRGLADRESRFERPEVRHWNRQEDWGRKVWKEAKESSVPKMVGQGVYGVGPVLAALAVERREFYALYVQEGLDLSRNNRKKKDKKGVEKVLKLAEKLGLKVVEASKHDLNMMVDNRPHQGLVLDASPLELVNVRELDPVKAEGQRGPVWVALDEVTDPQNLGAIIRSGYFFGVEGVIICAKNSAPLSGVVSKASAGSLELLELRSCKNMMQFLSSSVKNGWRVLGGSVASKAHPLNEVEAGVPTILVLGSEGSGLRPLVEKSCTELIKIPGNISMDTCEGEDELEAEEMDQTGKGQELKSFLAVESLNVSVAAGVLLYHLVGSGIRSGT